MAEAEIAKATPERMHSSTSSKIEEQIPNNNPKRKAMKSKTIENGEHDVVTSSTMVTMPAKELEALINQLVQKALHDRALNPTDFPQPCDEEDKRAPTIATATEHQMTDDDNLHQSNRDDDKNSNASTVPLEFSYGESTHKWFVYGKQSEPVYRKLDGLIGFIIISFQLCVYAWIIKVAVEDFQKDLVPVMINFGRCGDVTNHQTQKMDILFGMGNATMATAANDTTSNDNLDNDISTWFNYADYIAAPESFEGDPKQQTDDAWLFGNYSVLEQSHLYCEADTGDFGVGMAMLIVMLSLFLTLDFQDAISAIRHTVGFQRAYAVYAFVEVFTTWAACVAAGTQKVWTGNVVDALETGVGLLFVHDLGNRVFVSFKARKDGTRKYRLFFGTALFLIVISTCFAIGLTFLTRSYNSF